MVSVQGAWAPNSSGHSWGQPGHPGLGGQGVGWQEGASPTGTWDEMNRIWAGGGVLEEVSTPLYKVVALG